MCWQRCYVWIESRSKCVNFSHHYDDVTMTTIASQITSLMVVYLTVYSDADQRKHQSSASLAFVWGIHRGPVISPHKWPVTRKMFPFDDVIMYWRQDIPALGANTMPAEALAPKVARSSAGMVLAVYCTPHVLLLQSWFYLLGQAKSKIWFKMWINLL